MKVVRCVKDCVVTEPQQGSFKAGELYRLFPAASIEGRRLYPCNSICNSYRICCVEKYIVDAIFEDVNQKLIEEVVCNDDSVIYGEVNHVIQRLLDIRTVNRDKGYLTYRLGIDVNHEYGRDWDCDYSCNFRMVGIRLQTKEEKDELTKKERAAKLREQERNEARQAKALKTQRTMYERLKKKFESEETTKPS